MTHADDKELTLLLRGGLSESEKSKSHGAHRRM